MADAIRDNNRIPVWLAVSYVDGTTLVPIVVNSSNNGVKVDTTHSATPSALAKRDQNFVVARGAASSADGTFLGLFADPATGAILIDF